MPNTIRWYLFGYLGGLVAGIGFIIMCLYYAVHSEGAAINVLLCFFGAASGWFVGILISPSTEVQKREFGSYGKAISAFLSGFVLAKLDRVFELSFQADHGSAQIDMLLLRVLLFVIPFIVAALTMFAGRGFGLGVTITAEPPSL